MTNLQGVTGANFEIALEKFQQDLEDISRNQKTEDVLSKMQKNELIQEVTVLNGRMSSLAESFDCVHLEKGKIDEAFDALRKAGSQSEDGSLATKQIEELQAEIRRMKAENGDKSNDKGSSLSQFSSMETALKRSQERESELQHEVVNAEKKISNLEHQLKTTREKLETAEQSMKNSESEVVTLKEQLMVSMKKDSALVDSNKQKESLEKKITELKASICGYREEVSDKDGDIKRLRATIADKQSVMEGYVAEISRLKEGGRMRTESLSNRELESLKLKFDEVCKERDSLQREVARLVVKKQTEVSIQLESQSDSYRKQIRDKEETINRLRKESVTLQSENDALRARSISVMSSPTRYGDKDYDSLQRRYDHLWREKESLKKDFEEFKTRSRTSTVNIETSQQEIREKEVAIDRLRSKNITLQAQIEALRKENAEVSTRSEYSMSVQSSSLQLESNEEFYRKEIRDRDAVIDKLRSDTMTLHAEIDVMKSNMRSYYSRTDYEALQLKYDEVLKDRDALREQLIDIKSSSERDVSIHIESRMESFQQDVREKDVLIDKLRSENLVIKNELETLKRDVSGKVSVSDGYLAEIERLRHEILRMQTSVTDYESLKKTYDDVCKERDLVRNQLVTYKTHSEQEITAHIDSYSEAYRQDVREKEVAIDRFRSENTILRAELEGLRREMSTFYNRTEYESLKLQYDEMWKERDNLREQLLDIKSRAERDLLIMVENKTLVFQKQIREKEMEVAKFRSEGMTFQMTVDGLKRDLESKQYLIEGYLSEIERLKGEIANLKSTTVTITEYESVRRMYDDMLKERDTIRMELFELRSNSEREVTVQVENQVKIYREGIREKEVIINNFRSDCMKFQAENDRLKREFESKQYMIDGYLTEIDRLKGEICVMTKSLTEFESLKRSYDEVCRERDYIQRQFTDFKTRSEQETTFQIEIQTNSFRQEIKEKDGAIERFRSQNQMLIEEVDGLKRERSSFYSKSKFDSLRQQYEEMWKERDILRGQIAELKSKGERELILQIESRTETYRTEIREKETIIGRLQSDNLKNQTEIEDLKRQLGNQEAYLIEIERLKIEVNMLRFPDIRGSAEYMSLQRTYDEVCKERDGLRAQVIDIKMKGEENLETQVKIYREEIREKEVAFNQLRSEDMSLKAEIEGLKRQLGNQEAYLIEISRLKEEVNTLRFPDIRGSAEYVSLQCSYEEVCKERDGLRGQIVEVKMKGEQSLENQVTIYREQIREKEVAFNQLRSENMSLKTEMEGFKRQLGNQEAYLIEIERLKKEINTLRFPDIRGSAEYVSLQHSYEEICKERDGLRGQIVEIKMKGEENLENQVRIYREQIREKEVAFNQLRSEDMSLKAEIEGLKRELGSQEAYLVEIDRLKKEVNKLRFPDIRGSAEYVSLQHSYEEVCKERDGLRGQIVEIKMKGEENLESQVRIYREQIREKEVAFNQLRTEDMSLKAEIEGLKRKLGSQEAYLVEIDRLKKEVHTLRFPDIRGSAEYVTLQRSYEEACEERDGLRGQIVDIKMKGEENLESQVRIYREQIREKEVAFNQLRTEEMSLKAEIEGLKRELATAKQRSQMEVERVRKESSVVSLSVIRSSTEFVSLQRAHDAICKERDALRQQLVDTRTKSEREVSIQIDNQVRIYRDEIKEKDAALERLRLETITLRSEVESMKRELASKGACAEGYNIEIERMKREITSSKGDYESLKLKLDEANKEKDRLVSVNFTLERDLRFAKETPVHYAKTEQELYNLRAKYTKLQGEYNTIMLAKDKLEEEMVIKVNSGMADKQEYIYKLEKENRELKSENEYYEKTVDEKNTAIGDMRLKISELQKRIETLKKEVFVADEAYEKAELRLKEVLKHEYTPVTTYEVRRYKNMSAFESPKSDYGTTTTTYAVNKKSSDADALQFSATSTPVVVRTTSLLHGEQIKDDKPLGDTDLARAEGKFQITTATTKTVLNTDNDGESDAGSVSSASGRVYRSVYATGPSRLKTSSNTTYRTTTGYSTTGHGRSSVSGSSGYRSSYSSVSGRKYISGRHSGTSSRKIFY